MPNANDIKFYPAISASNGAINTTTALTESGLLHELFPEGDRTATTNGAIRYRKVFIKNEHATDICYNMKCYISNLPDNPPTEEKIYICEGTKTDNETNAAGYTYYEWNSYATASELKDQSLATPVYDITAGGYAVIWLKHAILAGCSGQANDTFAITADWDSTT